MILPFAEPPSDDWASRGAEGRHGCDEQLLESLKNSPFVWFVGFLSPSHVCERRPGNVAAMQLLLLAKNATEPLLELPEPVHVRSVTDGEVQLLEDDRSRILEAATAVAADPQSLCAFVWAMRGDKHLRVDAGGGAPLSWLIETLSCKLIDEIGTATERLWR